MGGISTFPRVGGKNGEIAQAIINAFPVKGVNLYLEAYGGSFGVGCQLLAPYPNEIYNDLDNYCFTTIRGLCMDGMTLLKKMYHETEYTQSYYTQAKNTVNAGFIGITDPIEKAKYTYTVLLQSFNGTCRGWRGSHSAFSSVTYFEKLLHKLPLVDRLKNVQVHQMDALKLIAQYKGRPDVLMYLDPPYTRTDKKNGIVSKRSTVQKIYKFDMTTQDQLNLLAMIQDAQAKIVLSGYHNNLYEALLTPDKGWYCYSLLDVYKSMSNSGLGVMKSMETEVIWTNYPVI